MVNICHSSITKFLRRWKETGSLNCGVWGGRPRSTTPAQDKILEKLCLSDRKKSASELNKEWRKKTRVSVTARTVNKRFIAAGLPAWRPRRTPLKTEKMKAKRLAFAQAHLHWTGADWKKVCFSDETWIQIRENGRLQFLRRRPGEAHKPECVITTTKHTMKVMIFGAISPSTKSKIIFKGTVDAKKYQGVLKQADVKNFVKCGRQQMQFMEDGAPAHRANSTKRWHQRNQVVLGMARQ